MWGINKLWLPMTLVTENRQRELLVNGSGIGVTWVVAADDGQDTEGQDLPESTIERIKHPFTTVSSTTQMNFHGCLILRCIVMSVN